MNETLEIFAREQLKEMLVKCTEKQQHFFKRMYAQGNLTLDISDVVDNMSQGKLDWAMKQCQRTLEKNNE